MQIHLFLILMVILSATQPLTAASQDDLKIILDEIDAMWRGESAEGHMKMTIKTAHYERELEMKYWSLGEEYFITRIESPKKELGTATLKRQDVIYNYLPKIDRTIKISSAMMSGAWMGSHITNDDIVQSSQLADDYTFKLLNNDEEKTWQIELKPKETAAVVWGKIIVHIRKEDKIPLLYQYYDEDLALVRIMEFNAVKKIGNRTLPTIMKVIPVDKKSEFTAIEYMDIKFGVDLKPDHFSLQRLKRLR